MTDKLRKKKKRKKKNYLLRLLVIIAVGAGLYFLMTSEWFDIDSVKVENNNYYTVEQVKDKAGIQVGKNIFSLKKSGIKDKLLKDPYFKNVKIKRKLPSTVVIDVTERSEKAAVLYNGTYIIIDSDGLVLRKAKTEPKITVIEGLTVKKAKEGKPLEAEENSILTDTLSMLASMEDSDLFFKKINTSSVIIKAHIYDELVCEGTPENLKESLKNGKLETTLYEMYSKGIKRGTIKIGSDNYCSFDPNVE
ncbi:cell division protein FtsQ/DivIB [Aminipila luticellarii]|uniref:FtsQ-type POTRA domain-containing protein n=1 Tax=Aminipila luticellarii TaxID=2507160 RepID=A0A410PWQ9_9FIRM|nr:FtsQ-type POTRA domain-containing protein [Aminipila luticellarii]QAT43306.1 FtsQ-type POTRA domain-containing protein [Aminipila luticellarii]